MSLILIHSNMAPYLWFLPLMVKNLHTLLLICLLISDHVLIELFPISLPLSLSSQGYPPHPIQVLSPYTKLLLCLPLLQLHVSTFLTTEKPTSLIPLGLWDPVLAYPHTQVLPQVTWSNSLTSGHSFHTDIFWILLGLSYSVPDTFLWVSSFTFLTFLPYTGLCFCGHIQVPVAMPGCLTIWILSSSCRTTPITLSCLPGGREGAEGTLFSPWFCFQILL
jgi:hypothetical protein